MSILLTIKSFFATIFAVLISLSSILSPVFLKWTQGETGFVKWSKDDEFEISDTIEIQKKHGKDFVILNLTDCQLSFCESYKEEGKVLKYTIDKLVEETQPDLITVTGDNAWCTSAYLWFVKLMDSYNIPWAPIMGNHDGQSTPSEWWCAYQLANARNCLFKYGPEGMGYGNYIINVVESDSNGYKKYVHTLFMMDTHSNCDDNENGIINSVNGSGGYDNLWANQMEWYEWAVNGIKELNHGETVESTLFIHIPLCEYKDAMALTCDIDESGSFTGIKEEYKDTVFGANHEGICSAPGNNGMFALIKSLGSTKNVICGHDHINSLSIPYEGVRLSYALKTGKGCYWEEGMNGGSVVTFGVDGEASFSHFYIDPSPAMN